MRAGRVFAGRPVPVSLFSVAARPGWCDRTTCRAFTCRVVDPTRCFVVKSVGRSRVKRGCRILGSSSSVQATKGTTKIPVEPYQFLGLQAGEPHTDSEIQSAHDELAQTELEPGYNVATVDGRLEVLEQAKKESMKSSKTFKAPKDPPEGVGVENRLVPAALALLCQVGEYEVLIDIGEKFLETESGVDVHNDINLAMGLAKLGQAEEIFNIPKASTACLKMEEAHRLLAETGSSPAAAELVNGIEECLIDIAPRSVKQQLMLPLAAEHEQDRQDAIEILKDLMAAPGKSSKRLFDRPVDRHFVKEALDRMTSEEILNLTDWAPKIREPKSTSWYYPGLLLKVAMAHIVVAFIQRRPSLLLDLEDIFSIPGKETEAHVERVVCHVLLGEPDKAIALLKRMEGNERNGKGRNLIQMGGIMANLEGGSGKQDSVVAAKELPARNETLAFVKANSPISKDGKQESLLAGLCLFTERWLSRSAMPHFRDTCERLPPPSLDDYFENERVSDFMKKTGAGSPLEQQQQQQEEEEEEEEEPSEKESPSNSSEVVETDGKSKEAAPVAEGKKKKSGKSSKKENKEKKKAKEPLKLYLPRKKPNPMLVALTGGAVLGAALFAYVYQPWVVEDQYETLTEAQQNTMSKLTAENPMTATMADNLVKKWQFAKSKALGPEHEIKFMGRILSPELLEAWKERVNDVVEQRLYWTYNSKCKVSDIDSSKFDGGFGHISIHAQLGESATMHDAKGKSLDKYKTSYKVVYEVLLDSEGKWRIKQINVLRQ